MARTSYYQSNDLIHVFLIWSRFLSLDIISLGLIFVPIFAFVCSPGLFIHLVSFVHLLHDLGGYVRMTGLTTGGFMRNKLHYTTESFLEELPVLIHCVVIWWATKVFLICFSESFSDLILVSLVIFVDGSWRLLLHLRRQDRSHRQTEGWYTWWTVLFCFYQGGYHQTASR